MNDQVRSEAKVPMVPDERAKVHYDSRYLVVTGAPPSHTLAMKVDSARGRDEEDIKWLMRCVGVRHMRGLEAFHREVFRGQGIPVRACQRLAELVRERAIRRFANWMMRALRLSGSSHAGTQMAGGAWLCAGELPSHRGTARGNDDHWLTIQAIGMFCGAVGRCIGARAARVKVAAGSEPVGAVGSRSAVGIGGDIGCWK